LLLDGDQPGVLAGKPDAAHVGFLAGERDPVGDLLVDRAGEDHLGDLRGLGVRHAQAIDEARFHAQRLEHRADLRAAAMDDDRIDADRLEQHDILGEIVRRLGIAHRVAAIFHDERLAGVALHIGQRFGERFRLGEECGIGPVAVGGHQRVGTGASPA